MKYDVIIIGAGVGGMTAALNALRGGKSCLILEKENVGGQIANSPRVENIPGTKEISGQEFSDKLFEQIDALGCKFELEDVLEVSKNGNEFIVKTNYNTYESLVVIIATGSKHRKIGVPREDELVGKGISYCAVCDGAFYNGEDVAIIGDANTALQYALLQANTSPKVYLLTLFNKFFADDILVKRVLEKKNIIVEHNLNLIELVGKNEISSIKLEDTKTHEIKEFNVKCCFICVGQIPDNNRFKNIVDLDKQGYIIANELCETKTSGLYAIGDCRVKKMRQVITACSDGAIAAIQATNYINSL
ncbi:MAG: FAD-dependent oxidoreductase [Bacilli bacterium]